MLSKYTTFKIGGPARYFYLSKNKDDLIEAISKGREENLNIFILGGGSNVLVSDAGFTGLVIKIAHDDLKIAGQDVFAGAGVELPRLVEETAREGLSGFEWMAGVPGTVGGAIYGNANAYGSSISDNLIKVSCLDKNDLRIKEKTKKECDFSEKMSVFKKNKNLIVLSASFITKKGERDIIEKENADRIALRASKHPLEFGNAGSVFINKPGQKLPSSYLVELAGLKGTKVGGAEVSTKHGGFIVNKGNATCEDILKLIEVVKKKVKEFHGVDLETEVQIIK